MNSLGDSANRNIQTAGPMPITSKILYSANTFCLLLFLGMAFVLPLHGQAQAQTRLAEAGSRSESTRTIGTA